MSATIHHRYNHDDGSSIYTVRCGLDISSDENGEPIINPIRLLQYSTDSNTNIDEDNDGNIDGNDQNRTFRKVYTSPDYDIFQHAANANKSDGTRKLQANNGSPFSNTFGSGSTTSSAGTYGTTTTTTKSFDGINGISTQSQNQAQQQLEDEQLEEEEEDQEDDEDQDYENHMNNMVVVRECWCARLFQQTFLPIEERVPPVYCPATTNSNSRKTLSHDNTNQNNQMVNVCRVQAIADQNGIIRLYDNSYQAICYNENNLIEFTRGIWPLCFFWLLTLCYVWWFTNYGRRCRNYLYRHLKLNYLLVQRKICGCCCCSNNGSKEEEEESDDDNDNGGNEINEVNVADAADVNEDSLETTITAIVADDSGGGVRGVVVADDATAIGGATGAAIAVSTDDDDDDDGANVVVSEGTAVVTMDDVVENVEDDDDDDDLEQGIRRSTTVNTTIGADDDIVNDENENDIDNATPHDATSDEEPDEDEIEESTVDDNNPMDIIINDFGSLDNYTILDEQLHYLSTRGITSNTNDTNNNDYITWLWYSAIHTEERKQRTISRRQRRLLHNQHYSQRRERRMERRSIVTTRNNNGNRNDDGISDNQNNSTQNNNSTHDQSTSDQREYEHEEQQIEQQYRQDIVNIYSRSRTRLNSVYWWPPFHPDGRRWQHLIDINQRRNNNNRRNNQNNNNGYNDDGSTNDNVEDSNINNYDPKRMYLKTKRFSSVEMGTTYNTTTSTTTPPTTTTTTTASSSSTLPELVASSLHNCRDGEDEDDNDGDNVIIHDEDDDEDDDDDDGDDEENQIGGATIIVNTTTMTVIDEIIDDDVDDADDVDDDVDDVDVDVDHEQDEQQQHEQQQQTNHIPHSHQCFDTSTPTTITTTNNSTANTADAHNGYEDEDDHTLTDNLCSICLCELVDGDIVGDIPCNHYFHKDCLKEWLMKSNLCPFCRKEDIASYHRSGDSSRNGDNGSGIILSTTTGRTYISTGV